MLPLALGLAGFLSSVAITTAVVCLRRKRKQNVTFKRYRICRSRAHRPHTPRPPLPSIFDLQSASCDNAQAEVSFPNLFELENNSLQTFASQSVTDLTSSVENDVSSLYSKPNKKKRGGSGVQRTRDMLDADSGYSDVNDATTNQRASQLPLSQLLIDELHDVNNKRTSLTSLNGQSRNKQQQQQPHPDTDEGDRKWAGPNNLRQFHVRKASRKRSCATPQNNTPQRTRDVTDRACSKTEQQTSPRRGEATWSQSDDEDDVTRECDVTKTSNKQTCANHGQRYQKSNSRATQSASAPVQKKRCRARKVVTSDHKRVDDVTVTRSADDDDDVTIQINLKMLKKGEVFALPLKSNSNQWQADETSNSLPVRKSSTSRVTVSSKKKPAPHPKPPPLVVAPKPNLKYTAHATSGMSATEF